MRLERRRISPFTAASEKLRFSLRRKKGKFVFFFYSSSFLRFSHHKFLPNQNYHKFSFNFVFSPFSSSSSSTRPEAIFKLWEVFFSGGVSAPHGRINLFVFMFYVFIMAEEKVHGKFIMSEIHNVSLKTL